MQEVSAELGVIVDAICQVESLHPKEECVPWSTLIVGVSTVRRCLLICGQAALHFMEYLIAMSVPNIMKLGLT